MEQKKLAALLRTKIAEEMKQFRNRMIKERSEIIYGSAYQINTKLNLCEMLMDINDASNEIYGSTMPVKQQHRPKQPEEAD